MGQKEKLEKQIDFLIQEFRGYFLVLIAISTGEASVLYAVVSGEKPIFVLVLAIIGFIVFLSLLLKVKAIKKEIYVKLNDLGDTT